MNIIQGLFVFIMKNPNDSSTILSLPKWNALLHCRETSPLPIAKFSVIETIH